MLLTRKRTRPIRLRPQDHGRRMSLDDFANAIAGEGHLYELSKGVIEVSQLPHPQHERQLAEIRRQLILWDAANPGHLQLISGATGSKLLIASSESERHSDLTLYLSPEPDVRDVWSAWIPEIVVEVVSESSAKRDYQIKPDEYLELGVREYWIVDRARRQMTALVRWRGQWQKKIVKPARKYATELLPGFKLDLKRVFVAGK